jgi:NADH dehydrogenase [ubiquinone] 1 alpha subcomplex assembly factor 7
LIGDFITSPEISPLFCELIGIWCVATWQAMGSPSQLKLVELGLHILLFSSSTLLTSLSGPGKGTLMKEILNTARSFPAFEKALTVHMVEVSEAMRKTQRNALLSNTPSPLNSTVSFCLSLYLSFFAEPL